MNISGILNVNKPKGITSFGVVEKIRRKLNVKRAGHCGTLDPDASGVLIVCFGSATKQASKFQCAEKVYKGFIRFGVSTDTDDLSGKVLFEKDSSKLTLEQIQSAAERFTGDIYQKVPAFSAVKHKGRCLYKYARMGIKVEQPLKRVSVRYFRIMNYSCPNAEFEAACSSGTYIRALARDMGEALSCGGVLAGLERVKSGDFVVSDSLDLEWLLSAPVEDIMQKCVNRGFL